MTVMDAAYRFHRDPGALHLAWPQASSARQADHRRESPPSENLGGGRRASTKKARRLLARPRPEGRYVGARGPSGSMGGSRMPAASAARGQGSAHLMFGPAPPRKRLIVPGFSPARPHHGGRTSPTVRPRARSSGKYESEAAPLIGPWIAIKIRQLPCADVVASLGVLAPLRIDQSFASGSSFISLNGGRGVNHFPQAPGARSARLATRIRARRSRAVRAASQPGPAAVRNSPPKARGTPCHVMAGLASWFRVSGHP